MTTQCDREGWPAVHAWNPTAKHHHLTMWFKKLMRIAAMKRGLWTKGTSDYHGVLETMEIVADSSVFDHWGSCVIDEKRVMFAMPYLERDDEASRLASVIGCRVTNCGIGPWHPKTVLYIFSELDGSTT